MTIVYKHPRFASHALRLYYHEGYFDEAKVLWLAYLDAVRLPELPICFGIPESWR